jgi:hypothetical protein
LKDRGVARPFKRKLPEAERLRYLNLKRNSFVAALRWHREEQAELARLLYDSLLGLQKAIVKKLEEGLKRPAHNYEAAKELAGIPPPMATSDQRRAAVAKADGIWEARIAEICRIAPSSRLPPSPSLKPATGIQTRLKVWRWIRTLGPRKKPGPKNGATKRAKATGRNATEGEASRSKKVASKQHGKMRDGARSRSRARAGKIGA